MKTSVGAIPSVCANHVNAPACNPLAPPNNCADDTDCFRGQRFGSGGRMDAPPPLMDEGAHEGATRKSGRRRWTARLRRRHFLAARLGDGIG